MSSDAVSKYSRHVGYNDEDVEKLKEGGHRIRHINALSKASKMYTIQVEVVSSKHCNTGYAAGDRLILDADGNLITRLNPKRLCVYLVSQMVIPVALINERLSEGMDPNDFHFMRYIRCPDAGVECLGYGQVLARVSVAPRE